MFGNMKFISVLNRTSHSFASLTLEISCSTLEINSAHPCIILSLYSDTHMNHIYIYIIMHHYI